MEYLGPTPGNYFPEGWKGEQLFWLKLKLGKESGCVYSLQSHSKNIRQVNSGRKTINSQNIFFIFVIVYYELKLKGFAYLEIFLTNHKAIKLWSNLAGNIKKIILQRFIVNTTTQPSWQHFLWWVLQLIFQNNNGLLAFQIEWKSTLSMCYCTTHEKLSFLMPQESKTE